MTDQAIARGPAPKTARGFYRPELDALRFFAFLAVLIHHGPASSGWFQLVALTGGFGLSMFFLLSAYLISELLLREREQTGTIAWNLFFTRRALRIWPLYYAAVIAGCFVALIPPSGFGITRSGIEGMVFFVANYFPVTRLGVLGPLWSISVEEQFYLIWPPIVRAGGKASAFAAAVIFMVSAGVWLLVFSGRSWKLWYDTPVEFLFFGTGVMIALATHHQRTNGMGAAMRSGLLAAGLFSLAVAAHVGGITIGFAEGLTRTQLCIGYGGAVAGCALIFFAILGLSSIPRPLIYLGKISYGLYVFHLGILAVVVRLAARLNLAHSPIFVDGVAFLLCTLAAHLSYRYFETPFLRLKARFEVIRSRPA
jgi:peptidoglycan/LPS O-acetylase OafA/YrhL